MRRIAFLFVGAAALVSSCNDEGDTIINQIVQTPLRSWTVSEGIEVDGAASSPQVAMDGSGNAIAVWKQDAGYVFFNIWANRYVVGTGWGTAELIETDDVGHATSPQVSMEASGNAVAVWEQHDGTRMNIWANRYVVGTGWGTAELIETDDAGDAQHPQVAVDASGNAFAVWEHSDGTRLNIWANRYVVGPGWGTAVLIETDDAGFADYPQVAVDASGYAIAVWDQSDGTRLNIWANRYVIGTGWGTAVLIETDDTASAEFPQVSADASGNAIAVWVQFDGFRNNICANRYAAGTGWGAAAVIETNDTGNSSSPQVSMDASGNAIAVWQQDAGFFFNNIWANRYTAGTGWGTAVLVETYNGGSADSPQVSVDAAGNAVAVWVQDAPGTINVWSNSYAAGTGWGTPVLIETDSDAAYGPQVAVDGSGNAIAVWFQYVGGNGPYIMSNRYH